MLWNALTLANLLLLVLFPLSWVAPLMRAGGLPILGLDEISVLSGIASLWHDDAALALIIAAFALVAPVVKTIAMVLVHFAKAPATVLPYAQWVGKLAMADIFLIALYITLAKGITYVTVEPAWGLWLFTACILASLAISLATSMLVKREGLR